MEPDPSWPQNLTDFLIPNIPRMKMHHMVCHIHVHMYVKWSCYRPSVTQRVGRGIALLFHDCGTRRGWVVSSMPWPHFTPGKDPVPILQEAGWAPGPVWGAEMLVPTGIRSRTVQPVVSRYTDWATRPTHMYVLHVYVCVNICRALYYLKTATSHFLAVHAMHKTLSGNKCVR